ncbi:hypothetical protein, partial [Marinobacter sp.]
MRAILIFVFAMFWPLSVHGQSLPHDVSEFVENLVNREFKSLVENEISKDADKDYETLGGLAALDGTQEVAIWAYKRDLDQSPLDSISLSSLGALLADFGAIHELHGLVAAAENLLIEAIVISPTEWTAYHNLAALYNNRGLAGGGNSDFALALATIEEAAKLAPKNPTVLMKYGEILENLGDRRADTLYRSAFLNDPSNISVLAGFSNVPNFQSRIMPIDPRQCEVDFKCDITCPVTAITPGLKHVSCWEAEAVSKTKCNQGKLYETEYSCKEKKPSFGILIPGLDPGLSISTPWGSFDLTVDKDGVRIDFSITAGGKILGPGFKFGLNGSWDNALGGSIGAGLGGKLGPS